MDLTKGTLEATVAYKERHDSLDAFIKVTAAAYSLVGRVTSGPSGDRVLGALYGSADEKWAPAPRVPSPGTVVQAARERATSLAITAVQSEMESAARDVVADVLEFWPSAFTKLPVDLGEPPERLGALGKRGWLGNISEYLRGDSGGDKLVERCHQMLGLKLSAAAQDNQPLLDLFRRIRNRTVHQDGVVGADLAAFSRSKAVKQAQGALDKRLGKQTPPLPAFSEGEPLILTASHAILFKIVASFTHAEFAREIRGHLDDDGYVRMASHYAYGLPHHPARRGFHRDVAIPLRSFLSSRYHLRDIDRLGIVADCKRLMLWDDMVKRFHVLYKK